MPSAGDTVYIGFPSDVNGAPTVLTGAPAVAIYKNNGTGESTAGVTLSASFDSRAGLNLVTIDTSADAVFYVDGGQYMIVVTAGTVGGVSVVNQKVGEFILGAASAPTANQNADALLARNIDGGSSTGRTVTQALSLLRNKTEIVAGVLTVYEQDGTTPMWEANVTTAAGNPLASVSPTT